MKIKYNQILVFLLFAYVFIAPFEDLLEFLYGIETIFKPYRIFGILLLLLGFFYRYPKRPLIVFPGDKLVVFYMVYAVSHTLLLWALGIRINLGVALNASIQMVFMLLVYLTIKRIDLTYKQFHSLMLTLAAGIILNAVFIIVDFYILSISTREKGMSDNSNYAASCMALAAQYFVYRLVRNKFAFSLENLVYLALLFYLFLAVLATGSRTGLILFIFSAFLQSAILTNWSTRVRLVPFGLILGVVLVLTPAFQELIDKSSTFNRLQGATTDIRVPLFYTGLNAIEDSWFFGIGISQVIDARTFAKYVEDVDPNFLAEVESRGKGLGLHNLYLELAVESGFIGLGVFLLWLFYMFRHQVQMLRYKPRQGEHTLILILFITVVITGLTGKGLLAALYWLMYFFASKYFIETEWDLTDPAHPVRINPKKK